MKLTFENAIATTILLATWAWFLHGYFADDPDWGVGIAFLAALGAIFSKDPIKRKLGWDNRRTSHDLELFNRFQKELPVEPTIRLFQEHHFGDAFEKEAIAPLHKFVYYWSSVDCEFVDKKLEREKERMYAAAKDLAMEVARATVPIADGSLLSVFPDYLRAQGPRPDHVIRDQEILNQKSTDFVPIYEAFVRLSRNRLGL